jgi:hypothetical protein
VTFGFFVGYLILLLGYIQGWK